MKATIIVEELQAHLKAVAGGINTKATLPIIGTVELTAHDNNTLQLETTNLSIGIRTTAPASVQKAGTVCIPFGILNQFVGQLPKDGKVNLELNEKTLSLSLTCQGYTATMKGMDPANFPLILQFADPTEDDPAISFTMNVGQLDAVIQDTVSAASTDDSRPMLTGVEFKSDGKTFTVAATDGYQLAKWQTDCELGTFSFIVPASGLKKIGAAMGLIGEDDGITVLYFAKKEKLFFQAAGQYSALDIELATIPGRFPDYNGIIPKSSDTIVTIDKDDLDAALKLAWPFAKENNKIVRFDIDGDKMTISARSMEAGDSIAVVPITSEGKAVGIALNMAYVKAAIAGMDGNVEIGLTTELRPATLQNGTDVLRVIMPMHPQR